MSVPTSMELVSSLGSVSTHVRYSALIALRVVSMGIFESADETDDLDLGKTQYGRCGYCRATRFEVCKASCA